MNDDLDYLDIDPVDGDSDDQALDSVNIEGLDDNLDDHGDDGDSNKGDEGDTSDQNSDNDDDLLVALLKSKGIKDPSAIKYEDEQGNIQEVDFNSLSREEQLNILNSSDLDDNYGLEPEETEFISLLRDNNLSVEDYLDYVRNKAIEDFVAANSEPHYEVDKLSDEELYLLDLKYNFGDITEEEAQQYLEHEKANETLWNKKIQALRDGYKAKEEAKIEEQKLVDEAKDQEAQEAFANSMIEAINGLKTIESFDLEDEDRERIAEFILGTDATGTNYMYRALKDPESIVKMAWFLLDGADSIKALNDYWTDVVKQHSQTKYEEGYKDALSGKKSKINKKSSPYKSDKQKTISLGSDIPILDLD